ncbi:unnamed protein product [Dicrocoelium dendriticum]|nr:unnamed protein product [Dicrocoelium dendriticum]
MGKRKFHFTFDDETELVEEYDAKSHCLLARKWKRRTPLGGESRWEYEVGEPPIQFSVADEITESNTNPRFSRMDTIKAFQWRIRNLPYPLDTYSIKLADNGQTLELKTRNNKYYKKFDIPDMKRLNLPLSQEAISMSHANNTLLISYAKSNEVLAYEKLLKDHLSTVKSIDQDQGDCKTS